MKFFWINYHVIEPHATYGTGSYYDIVIFESHKRLWSMIVERKLPYAFIYEDDVLFSKEISRLILGTALAKNEIDILKTNATSPRRRFGQIISIGEFEIRPIIEQPHFSAACYYISLNGAKYLLDLSSVYCDSLDYFIFLPRQSYKLFQIFPVLAIQVVLMDNNCINRKMVPLSGVPSLGSLGKVHCKSPLLFQAKREINRGIKRLKRFAYLTINYCPRVS